ncbi:acyl carrier protein 3, mitochondrial-like [Dorcoceras hygrometricum]|uniref:Acyl carrier protein n=1 Tax=Dorcoceras hygrometricum TaxID=472368 RepID=A0A2Z7CJJ0_9LAMI|nr:acyl carrier protein 3, mitochondrial-like [Dorcoceras hygrometricum]
MLNLRHAILSHVRIGVYLKGHSDREDLYGMWRLAQLLHTCSTAASTDQDHVLDRVVGLVKKFDKIDAAKVTETADFQKDLSLDSLDRVELVMVFEEEFSVEIPDAEADKLKCCADVAKYITSGPSEKNSETS